MEDQIEEQAEEQIEEIVEEVEVEEQEENEAPASSQAQALFDLFNNPATAKSALQMVASNLGMTVSEAKTEEGKTAIRDVIKMALGEDLAFIGDKLGPLGDAIEKLLEDRISKSELKMIERQQAQEAIRVTAVIESTMKELNTETKGEFDALTPKINNLMEEIPIGKQSPDQYLRRLFNIAKTEAAGRVTKTPTERSQREALKTGLKSQPNTERVQNGSTKNLSYREAIQQAIDAVSKGK